MERLYFISMLNSPKEVSDYIYDNKIEKKNIQAITWCPEYLYCVFHYQKDETGFAGYLRSEEIDALE